eukprot:944160-Prorocentrum_minimum.AAC.1
MNVLRGESIHRRRGRNQRPQGRAEEVNSPPQGAKSGPGGGSQFTATGQGLARPYRPRDALRAQVGARVGGVDGGGHVPKLRRKVVRE